MQAEHGQALILALIVVMIVSIAAVSIIAVVTSTQNTSMRERQAARAFTGSEAGLDLAANAVIAQFPAGSTSLPPAPAVLNGSRTVDGSSVDWTATYAAGPSGSPGTWKLEAKTVSPNGRVTRLLQGSMEPSVSSYTLAQSTIYGYGLVTGGPPKPSGSTPAEICNDTTTSVWGGSESVTVPIWITGDVCMRLSTAGDPIFGNPTGCAVAACKIPVAILGQLVVETGPDNAIGESGNPVASAAILGGCWSHGTPVPCDYNSVPANGGGSGAYADDFAPALPWPQPSKPTVDAASVYNQASPGPANPCTTGSTGSTFRFDNDTTPVNTSINGGAPQDLVSFLGPTLWDCQTATGRLSWTPGVPAGTDGTLYVSGTVFIDASLTVNHQGSNQGFILLSAPSGGGSIYVNGTVDIDDGASLCALYNPSAPNDCDFANWTPNTDPTDVVVFLAALNNGSPSTDGWTMGNHSYFEGLAFTNGGFFLDPNAEMAGSVYADYGTIKGNAQFTITNNVPQGAPGASSTVTTTTWSVSSRSWRECPSVAGCS